MSKKTKDDLEMPAADPAPTEAAEKKTIEQWRDELGTPAWLWAGMKLGKTWPIGKEVTRTEYDAALDWAANVPCR